MDKTTRNAPWGNVTNPSEHNPNNFRYLVHAYYRNAESELLLLPLKLRLDKQKVTNKKDGDQTIDLAMEPQRLGERAFLPCSLIDQAHIRTFGPAGLIIYAPKDNILITSPFDAATAMASKGEILKRAQGMRILSSEDLLRETKPSDYNEVVVLANASGKRVRLAGFFYKTTVDGVPIDTISASLVEIHASHLNLPLVAIRSV